MAGRPRGQKNNLETKIKMCIANGGKALKFYFLLTIKPRFSYELAKILKGNKYKNYYHTLKLWGLPVCRTKLSGRCHGRKSKRRWLKHNTTIYYLDSQRKEAYKRIEEEFGELSNRMKNSLGFAILKGYSSSQKIRQERGFSHA